MAQPRRAGQAAPARHLEFSRYPNAPEAPEGLLEMDVTQEVLRALDEVLSLGGRSASFTRATHLLGSLPELDSMAVVSLITGLEDRFGIVVDDDDIDGDTFGTVGSLSDFVASKLNA